MNRRLLLAAVFVVVFAVHVLSPVMTSWDSRWTIPTAVSIVHEGNADLDEYRPAIEVDGFYGIERVDGHLRMFHPLAVSLLAVPFVAIADRLNPHPAGAPKAVTFSVRHAEKIERFIASLIVATTTLIVFLTANVTLPALPALGLAGVFAFGTPAWSVASRGLWQHGPSMLLLAIALHFFVRARTKPELAAFAGIPVALAYAVRPTNAVAVVVFTLLVAWRWPRMLPRYLLCALPAAAAFVGYSVATYHSFLPPYHRLARIEGSPWFWTALAGNLVSPGRGLFVYVPLFLLCFAGVALKLRQRTFDALDGSLVALCVLEWVAISSFPHWWAGHSYGPRFFCDLLPVFVYFLIPVVEAIRNAPSVARGLLTVGFAALALAGVLIHARGAIYKRTWYWNSIPVNVDRAPERLWDFRDPAFLR
ncbi:MAG TPA: hypothetical protein VG496_04330 [Myxococcales bacterium]|nr:hypothetical protein [Myxococcales bacterium]